MELSKTWRWSSIGTQCNNGNQKRHQLTEQKAQASLWLKPRNQVSKNFNEKGYNCAGYAQISFAINQI